MIEKSPLTPCKEADRDDTNPAPPAKIGMPADAKLEVIK
jgi:hypothetical protein